LVLSRAEIDDEEGVSRFAKQVEEGLHDRRREWRRWARATRKRHDAIATRVINVVRRDPPARQARKRRAEAIDCTVGDEGREGVASWWGERVA
jgi:hypothetical protein